MAQGVNGEPVTRSSREGVHLELQIKHGGLGPHGEAFPENGHFGVGIGIRCGRVRKMKTQFRGSRFATPDDTSVHLALQ